MFQHLDLRQTVVDLQELHRGVEGQDLFFLLADLLDLLLDRLFLPSDGRTQLFDLGFPLLEGVFQGFDLLLALEQLTLSLTQLVP